MAQDPKLPVDARGRVRVWQVGEQKWMLMHPIDAREQLRRGIVTLDESARPAEVAGEILPAAHLPELTVKELEEYVEESGLDVNLSQHRLKEEKVKAVQDAIKARNESNEDSEA